VKPFRNGEGKSGLPAGRRPENYDEQWIRTFQMRRAHVQRKLQ
jgi:hypothetical protein